MAKVKGPSSQSSGAIVPPKVISDQENIVFTFSYFNSSHAISAHGQDAAYFHDLLERLKAMCGFKVKEFREAHAAAYNPKSIRAHKIDWTHHKCSQKGFGVPQREDLDAIGWQFTVSKSKRGRVHGFLIDRVFYVVWLDPEHKLYPWDGRE
jgi:hypothetical protein